MIFFNLVESQSGLIQPPRSDSYRAGLKNRSGPWCNPSGVLSAQTFVVSDKHSSIQKTICQSLPSFSNFAFVFSNVLPCVELLLLQELLLINICHLLQEAVMTSILRECPNARKHFLMTPYFEISWPVKCFIMTPPQWRVYTASSYSRKFYKFYAVFDKPLKFTLILQTQENIWYWKPNSVCQ